jgi:hypothetical protein
MSRGLRTARSAAPLILLGLGLLGGLVAYLAQPSEVRAQATLAVGRAGAPATTAAGPGAAVLALARSETLRANVAHSLGLRGGARYRVSTGQAGVIVLRDDEPTGVAAVRVVQQAASVLGVLTHSQFPALSIATIDPAHVTGTAGADAARDLGIGACAGLALACAALALRGRGTPTRAATPSTEGWEIARLRALADDGDERDDRRAYLAMLEPHARDGVLPPEFDELVAETFTPQGAERPPEA